MPPRYHCGNWLATVLKLSYVESVIIVGQNSNDLKGRDFLFAPMSDLLSQRLRIFPYEKERVKVPFLKADNCKVPTDTTNGGTELLFESVAKLGSQRLADKLAS